MKDKDRRTDTKLTRRSFMKRATYGVIGGVIGVPFAVAMARKIGMRWLVSDVAYASGEVVKPVQLSFEPTGDTCPVS